MCFISSSSIEMEHATEIIIDNDGTENSAASQEGMTVWSYNEGRLSQLIGLPLSCCRFCLRLAELLTRIFLREVARIISDFCIDGWSLLPTSNAALRCL